jgi:hypothetical protein
MNIKKWYLDTYNDDEGLKINDSADFREIDYAEIRNIYEYLNVEDSIIRERVFEKLAELVGATYQEIYDIWLGQ